MPVTLGPGDSSYRNEHSTYTNGALLFQVMQQVFHIYLRFCGKSRENLLREF